MQSSRPSMQIQLLLAVLAVSALVFGAGSTLVARAMVSQETERQNQWLREYAERQASLLKSSLGTTIGLVRGTALALGGIRDLPVSTTHPVVDSLFRALMATPEISAAYVNFEPGRFYPAGFSAPGTWPGTSWFRDGKGRVRLEPSGIETVIGDDDDWYNTALHRGRESLVEPYLYSYDEGEDSLLMTSFTAPVMAPGGLVAGVVGVDIPLDSLRSLVDGIRPLEGSFATLLSGEGVVLADPRPARLGMRPDSARPEILDSIAGGRPAERTEDGPDGGIRIQYASIPIGATGQAWSLAVACPVHAMMAPVLSLRRRLVLYQILGGLLLVGTMWLFAGRLVAPLRIVSGRLHDIAQGEGDLTRTLEPEGARELRELAQGFNLFVAKTRTTIAEALDGTGPLSGSADELGELARVLEGETGEAARGSETVAASALHMSGVAQEISRASERSSAHLEHVAAAVEQMNASVGEISSGAAATLQVGQEALQATDQAVALVEDLARSSREIEEVVGLIARISEQTKLLALNARIEAARAGDAGKGFAIVAEEVKQLARDAFAATGEISERVEAMRGTTGAAVERIGSIRRVVASTAHAQQGIASSVEEQSAAVREIASNLAVVSCDVREVSQSIRELAEDATNVSGGISEVQRTEISLLERYKTLVSVSSSLRENASLTRSILSRFRV